MRSGGLLRQTRVLGVPIAATNPALALSWIAHALRTHHKGYVCFVNVHGLMESLRDIRMAASYSAASLRVPDGAPVAWIGWLHGEHQMRRVAGPELMLDVFRDLRMKHATHLLYGGEAGVVEALKQSLLKRFPGAHIVGAITPPFHELKPLEEQQLIEQVRRMKPDIIWVGLGCPKQEQFMHRYLDRLDTTLMLGVGAAFDFHTGRLRDSPVWVKRAGLQWFHRLLQDPRRLWKRYLGSNARFLARLVTEFLGIRTTYPDTVAQHAALKDIHAPHPRPSR